MLPAVKRPRRLRIAPLPLLLVAALGACSSETSEFAAFDAAMESFVADNALEGATAVIVHRDRGVVHLAAYGAFDVDRISLIASSGKIVSAGVLMRLADDGLIDLDEPISTYLGDDWGDYKTDITVAQMLSNSAGMPGLVDDPTYGPYLCQYLDASDLETCAQSIYQADDAADRVEPDTEFHYGGGQWQLAGGLAQLVTGKTWAELVDETYVQPCGLGTLGFTNQYTQAFLGGGGVGGALSYPEFFDGDLADLPETTNPSIEGGSYTTARDYGEILLMHLRGGLCGDVRVLSEASVARMQEDRIGDVYDGVTIDPRFQGYGFGWWVSRDEPGVVADAGAYGAMPWLDTERGYGVMIILEAGTTIGADVYSETKPILDAIFDAASPDA